MLTLLVSAETLGGYPPRQRDNLICVATLASTSKSIYIIRAKYLNSPV